MTLIPSQKLASSVIDDICDWRDCYAYTLLFVRRYSSPTCAIVLSNAYVRSLVHQWEQIFLEFCMDMRFVDLICMISSSEGYLDLPQANLCRIMNTALFWPTDSNYGQLLLHLPGFGLPVQRHNSATSCNANACRHSIQPTLWGGLLAAREICTNRNGNNK